MGVKPLSWGAELKVKLNIIETFPVDDPGKERGEKAQKEKGRNRVINLIVGSWLSYKERFAMSRE